MQLLQLVNTFIYIIIHDYTMATIHTHTLYESPLKSFQTLKNGRNKTPWGTKSTQTLTCTISKMYCINVTVRIAPLSAISYSEWLACVIAEPYVCVWHAVGVGQKCKIVSTPSLLLFIRRPAVLADTEWYFLLKNLA